MKNKRILKQSLFILLGFVILALYIYTKRLESQENTTTDTKNSSSSIVTEPVENNKDDLLAPPVSTAPVPSNTNGGIPAPKPAN